MKKIIIFGASLSVLMLAFTACGGGEEETEENAEGTEETTEEVAEVTDYTVDTEASVINWYTMHGEEKAHWGTTKISEGTFTVEGDQITSASLTMDMGTVTADDEMGAKLLEHLNTPDFLNPEAHATSSFTFDKHEDGVIYGTLNVAGFDMDVQAPATLNEGTVEISDFKVDMVQFPFFQTERAEKPEAEWHDTMVGFTATIVGK